MVESKFELKQLEKLENCECYNDAAIYTVLLSLIKSSDYEEVKALLSMVKEDIDNFETSQQLDG